MFWEGDQLSRDKVWILIAIWYKIEFCTWRQTSAAENTRKRDLCLLKHLCSLTSDLAILNPTLQPFNTCTIVLFLWKVNTHTAGEKNSRSSTQAAIPRHRARLDAQCRRSCSTNPPVGGKKKKKTLEVNIRRKTFFFLLS